MKKKLFRIALILFIIGVLAAIGTYLYVFHKPHRDVESEKPAYVMTADQLLNDFSNNEKASNDKYGDKVIQISGEVVEYSMKNDVATVTFVSEIQGVSCNFEADKIKKYKSKMAKIQVGKKVTLKGKCDGYDEIMGVVLTRCVLL